jgi:hypothetical protein
MFNAFLPLLSPALAADDSVGDPSAGNSRRVVPCSTNVGGVPARLTF